MRRQNATCPALSFAAFLAIAATLGPLAALPAQSATERRLEAIVADAKAALAADDIESCALAARKARALLDTAADPRLERRFGSTVLRYERKDNYRANRQRAIDSAAKQLCLAADRYLTEGWRLAALPLLREAAAISADVAGARLAKLLAELYPDRDETGGNDRIRTLFDDRDTLIGGEWRLDADALVSPAVDVGFYKVAGDERITLARSGSRIRVEIRPPDGEAETTLMFGYRHLGDAYGLTFDRYEANRARLMLQRWHDPANPLPKILGQVLVDAKPTEDGGWLALEARFQGGALRARAGEGAWIEGRIEADGDLDGLVVLQVRGNALGQSGAAFRNLEIGQEEAK